MRGTAHGGDGGDGLDPTERLLLRLERYKRTGSDRWMALCPAHADKNPSLSIKEVDDGKLLIDCFAGCDSEDVLAAVGLDYPQLFPDDPDWRPSDSPRKNGHDRRGLAAAAAAAAQRYAAGLAPDTEPDAAPDTAERAAPEPDTGPDTEPDAALHWIPAARWIESLTAPDWLIRDYLERGTLNVTVGGWGSGKSAVELDRALRYVHGLPWHGIAPSSAGIWVYVVGEAQRGFQRRIAAWHAHHGLEPTERLVIIPEAVLIGQPDADAALRAALEAIQRHYAEAVACTTLDTLARCFGLDDENANSDVGRWLHSVTYAITEATGGATSVLHHPGHRNQDRGRGASALPGATDAAWLIERAGNQVLLQCTKNKDGDMSPARAWRIEGQALTIDGEACTAPVVVECEAPARGVGNLTAKQRQILDLLVDMYAEAERNLTGTSRAPYVDRAALVQRAVADGICAGANAARNHVAALEQAGSIVNRRGQLTPAQDTKTEVF